MNGKTAYVGPFGIQTVGAFAILMKNRHLWDLATRFQRMDGYKSNRLTRYFTCEYSTCEFIYGGINEY
jgi:hypothetical protein